MVIDAYESAIPEVALIQMWYLTQGNDLRWKTDKRKWIKVYWAGLMCVSPRHQKNWHDD